MSEPVEPTYTVIARQGEVTGSDTVIARAPDAIVRFMNFVEGSISMGGPIPDLLRQLGESCANNLQDGSLFRDGKFWITQDRVIVEAYGVDPVHADCDECLVGVKNSLAIMDANPGMTMIVGQLRWTLE